MNVVFESCIAEASALRTVADARIRFVIRRMAWLVPRARVCLSDVNGPRGGVDKRCTLQLHTDRVGTVVVTAVASDWHGALDGALARASQALRRALQRSRSPLRDARRPLVAG